MGGLGLGDIVSPVFTKATALFATLTVVQKAGLAVAGFASFVYATGTLLRNAVIMVAFFAYFGWCATLPISIPYTVEDFETLQVHVGSNSIRSERLRGDYEQTDMFHNGARVYSRKYHHEEDSDNDGDDAGDDEAVPMHLHFHVTNGGSCYWRIGTDLSAPNKDQSVRALTGPNCRVLGLSDLAASRKVRWDIHTGGKVKNDGTIEGKMKWTKDRGVSIEPHGSLGTYYLNPPNEVMLAHVLAAAVFWFYYRWQANKSAADHAVARAARAEARKLKRKKRKAERKAAKKAKEEEMAAAAAKLEGDQAALESPAAIAEAEAAVAAAKAAMA